MKFRSFGLGVALLVPPLLAGFSLLTVNVGALNDPGPIETYLASLLKRALIHSASKRQVPLRPRKEQQVGVGEGDQLFSAECAACHGLDGRAPTDIGRWMSPRAANLGSPEVQQYTDAELFWIIKNGVRFSGMPAFGKVESDEHIWNLVQYVRRLRKVPGEFHRDRQIPGTS
jgi:mono/diheme cytochrome c family protein